MSSSAVTCHEVNSTEYWDLLQLPAVRAGLAAVWISVGLMMFFGNLLVVCTICLHRAMRTVTNCYVLNLAAADLMAAALVVPLKGLQLLGPCWLAAKLFNRLGCAFVTFCMMVLVFASLFTLVVICIERFLAIVHPLRSLLFQSSRRTCLFILLTWCVPAAFCLVQAMHPAAQAFHSVSGYGDMRSQHCMDSFSPSGRYAYVMSAFCLLFLLPLCVVVFTSASIVRVLQRPVPGQNESSVRAVSSRRHGRGRGSSVREKTSREESKRKVAKMMIVVAALFLVSWTPWFAVNVAGLFYRDIYAKNYGFTMVMLHLVGFANSTANPVVYYFMSQRFRLGYRRVLAKIFCCFDWHVGADSFDSRRQSSANLHRRQGGTEIRRADSSGGAGRLNAAARDRAFGCNSSIVDADCLTHCESALPPPRLSSNSDQEDNQDGGLQQLVELQEFGLRGRSGESCRNY